MSIDISVHDDIHFDHCNYDLVAFDFYIFTRSLQSITINALPASSDLPSTSIDTCIVVTKLILKFIE